jgi:hypothetical protein
VAAAAPVADASCDPAGGGSITTVGNNRVAEVFTALHTGPLASIDFTAYKDAAGTPADFVVSINTLDLTGVPTDTVLASQTVANPAGGAGTYPLTASFATPATVTAGDSYAVVFSRPGSNFLGLDGGPDTCPGQTYIAQPDPFSAQAGFDVRFFSFVGFPDPPAPGPPAAGPTGQRAAALKKCAKLKSKKKKKKCKKRARLLPV